MNKALQPKKELLSCPSDTIIEILTYEGLDNDWLKKQMNINDDDLARLMIDNTFINESTASLLEKAFDVPISFWLNLQAEYEQELKDIEEMESKIKAL